MLDFIYQIKDIVGEIVINDIDKDGTMNGINTEIVQIINHHISVPLIIIGGAGSINHVREVIENPDSQFTPLPTTITPIGLELNPAAEPIEEPLKRNTASEAEEKTI